MILWAAIVAGVLLVAVVGVICYRVGISRGHKKQNEELDYLKKAVVALSEGTELPVKEVEKIVRVPVLPSVCGIGGCDGIAKHRCSAGSCAKHCERYCGPAYLYHL